MSARGGKGGLQLIQGKFGPRYLPDGEIGISIDKAGGEPHAYVRAGEIGLHLFGRLLWAAAEIVVLGKCDVPLGTDGHGFHRLPAVAWGEGRVHQWHQVGVVKHGAGGRLRRGGFRPLT